MDLGDHIPTLSGVDCYGNPFSDQDLEGTPALLFFFSKNNSPEGRFLCQAYSGAIGEFEELELQLIGINEEEISENLLFTHRDHLLFPLLSDPNYEIATACGLTGNGDPLAPAALLFDWNGTLCWKEFPIYLKEHVNRLLYAAEVNCGCKSLQLWYEENKIGTEAPGAQTE